VTATAPVGTARAYVQFVLTGALPASSNTMDVTGAFMTTGSTVYGYADGDTAGWSWSGTSNASSSSGKSI
jgi:hypothetical protein